MTLSQQLAVVGILAFATAITRFLPFFVFSDKHKTPAYVHYLGAALPAAIFSMLVVYCLKGVSLAAAPYGAPEAIAILATAAVHKLKGQTLLSIAAGTVCYMCLVQFVF